MGLNPFQIVYGSHPRGVIELREFLGHDKVSGHADDFAESMMEIHDQVKKH